MTLRGAVKATVVSTTSRAKQRAAGEGNNIKSFFSFLVKMIST